MTYLFTLIDLLLESSKSFIFGIQQSRFRSRLCYLTSRVTLENLLNFFGCQFSYIYIFFYYQNKNFLRLH